MNFKMIALVAVLIVGLTPLTTAKSMFCSNTNNDDELQNVRILFDSTSELPIKAAKVLDGLVNNYVPVTYQAINTWDELKATVQGLSAQTLVVYAFHGSQEGLTIGTVVYPWDLVANSVILPNVAQYHAFLACDSNCLPVFPTKVIFTQEGQVDYTVSVMRVGYFIATTMDVQPLATDLSRKVATEQLGLLARMFLAPEPMWDDYTHSVLTTCALEEIWKLNWVNTSLGMSQITSVPLVKPAFINPDNEGAAAQGGRDILKQVALLIQALSGTNTTLTDTLTQTLWHVSFGTNIDIDVEVPLWYATTKNWDGNDILTKLDNATTGGIDGKIIIKTTQSGTATEQITTCFTKACGFLPHVTTGTDDRFSPSQTIPYPWVGWLSRSAHFLQDIQNPFHTSFSNVNENTGSEFVTKTFTTLDLKFNARALFITRCEQNFIAKEAAEYIFDTYAEDILNGQNNDLQAWCDTVIRNLPTNIFAWLVGSLVGGGLVAGGVVGGLLGAIIAVGVSLLLVYPIAAAQLLLARSAFISDYTTFKTTKQAYVTAVNASLLNYSTAHDNFESRISQILDGVLAPKYSPSSLPWQSQLQSDLHAYVTTTGQYQTDVANFANDGSKRTTLINLWDGASTLVAGDIYRAVKSSDNLTTDTFAYTRLREALKQTAVLWGAYFYAMGMKDTDNDGFSDYIEENFFRSDPTFGGHSSLVTEVMSTAINTMSVLVCTKSGIPCHHLNVKLAYRGYSTLKPSVVVSGFISYDISGQAIDYNDGPFEIVYGRVTLQYLEIVVTYYDYGGFDSQYNLILAATPYKQNVVYTYTPVTNPVKPPIYEI